jgi:hypothetical protein
MFRGFRLAVPNIEKLVQVNAQGSYPFLQHRKRRRRAAIFDS